jgi:DNA-binding transcriptional LysR family regulator
MDDLNDLYITFSEVVRHGGFAQAGCALHQPKSTLSRHVAHFESTLSVRLIERSTRRFKSPTWVRRFMSNAVRWSLVRRTHEHWSLLPKESHRG